MRNIYISASILSADFSELGATVAKIQASGADRLHADIMDGVFVPPITFGPKVLADVRKRVLMPVDAHLMTVDPQKHLEAFAEAGADSFTFHIEAQVHAHRLASDARARGMKAGISLVPSTPVQALDAILPFVDQVLVMTVNPGWGGQELIPECLDKIRYLSEARKAKSLGFLIAVDGGVNEGTSGRISAAGADILVSGTSVIQSGDMKAAIEGLRRAAS